MPRSNRIFFTLFVWGSLLLLEHSSLAQVALRDTIITWQHHRFELNEDNSIKSFSTDDTDIQEVNFNQAKVIENEYIRLVLLPEYGGRVLSFNYKPTNHEYLYQSECGSAYGIGDNNFYYDWLMVYGGIFPTFPEPEHGKTWFLPWDYSIIKNSSDTVTIRMEYTDNTAFSGAPGQFNNGVTNITCQIDVSVYANRTNWDYEVTLINNNASSVKYEYWTCTTLSPGSEEGETGSPLNSEIIVPVEKYFAGWSPGAWIGNFNSSYNLSEIDYLSKWNDMGIAYAENLQNDYWGVINHDNEEGIFRVADNSITYGMKLWTWGKNNVDNNLYDYSNGGADNYIELWGGVSRSFFSDAVMQQNEIKNWNESYYATTGLSSVANMNDEAAVNLLWDADQQILSYQLNTFLTTETYTAVVAIDGEEYAEVPAKEILFTPMGSSQSYSLGDLRLNKGEHVISFMLLDSENDVVLQADKIIDINIILAVDSGLLEDQLVKLRATGDNQVELLLPNSDNYSLRIVNISGQVILSDNFSGDRIEVRLPNSGLYILNVISNNSSYSSKIYFR